MFVQLSPYFIFAVLAFFPKKNVAISYMHVKGLLRQSNNLQCFAFFK